MEIKKVSGKKKEKKKKKKKGLYLFAGFVKEINYEVSKMHCLRKYLKYNFLERVGVGGNTAAGKWLRSTGLGRESDGAPGTRRARHGRSGSTGALLYRPRVRSWENNIQVILDSPGT